MGSNHRKRKSIESRNNVWDNCIKIRGSSFNFDDLQTKLTFQANKNGTSLTTWIFDKNLAREKYTKMIIVDELPFKFGDGSGFREFMIIVQPMFQIPSRWTVHVIGLVSIFVFFCRNDL